MQRLKISITTFIHDDKVSLISSNQEDFGL